MTERPDAERQQPQHRAAEQQHAIAAGAVTISLPTRATAASWMPAKQPSVARSIRSGRPEWPIVTRVTIATSMPPKKPMPSAWIGARPSAHSPVSVNDASRIVCSSHGDRQPCEAGVERPEQRIAAGANEVQRTAQVGGQDE